MLITKEDKIKTLFALKGYSAKQLARQFTSKGWNVRSVYKLQKFQSSSVQLCHRTNVDNGCVEWQSCFC